MTHIFHRTFRVAKANSPLSLIALVVAVYAVVMGLAAPVGAEEAAPVEGATPEAPSSIPLVATPAQRDGARTLFTTLPRSATPSLRSTPSAQEAEEGEQPRIRPSSGARIAWVFLYFLVLMGVFVGVLYLIKRYMPGAAKVFSHPGVEVLGRTPLDTRRYLALVRFGRRLVMVGVSPEGGIRKIGEVTEAGEVTELLELSRPKTEAGKSVFAALFQQETARLAEDEKARAVAAQAEEYEKTVSNVKAAARSLGENSR